MLSTFFKYILALSVALAGSASFADPVSPEEKQRTKIWTETWCETHTQGSCVAAYGWAWLHTNEVVFQDSGVLIGAGAATWFIGAVLVNSVTDTPVTTFILTTGRESFKIGTVMFFTGVAMVAIGTVFSVVSFYLGSTTSTAGPEQDEPMTRECIEKMAPFKGPGGVEKFKNLSLEEFQALAACIPKDKAMNSFTQGLGRKSMELENQIHAN